MKKGGRLKNFPSTLEHGSGAAMLLDTTRLLLTVTRRWLSPSRRDALLRLLAAHGLAPEQGHGEPSTPGETVNHSGERLFVQAPRPIDQRGFDALTQALAAAAFGLDWIGPVYRLPGERGRRALLAPLPQVLLVRLRERDGIPPELRGPLLLEAGAPAPMLLEAPDKARHLNGYRHFTILNPREVNAYQLRRRLARDGGKLVLDAQFETMPLLRPAKAASC